MRQRTTDADDLVKQLRTLAFKCDGELMQLPVEMVSIIDHGVPEIGWEWVDVRKVLQYISDMLEE